LSSATPALRNHFAHLRKAAPFCLRNLSYCSFEVREDSKVEAQAEVPRRLDPEGIALPMQELRSFLKTPPLYVWSVFA
jgi:hypothetical protein